MEGIGYDVKTLVEAANTQDAGTFNYGDITSVAISPDGTKLAAAVQHADYDKAGKIAVFTCKEGATDPAGTVTILDLNKGESDQIGFEGFTAEELTEKNILIGKSDVNTVLEPQYDLEPEYIAVSSDGKKAYVSLQEANAIAVLDIGHKTFTGIYSVGFEDYSKVPVDIVKNDKYEAATYDKLCGARMPDGIAIYEQDGKTYLLTANEGDSRDWTNYCNEAETTEYTGKKIKIIDNTLCAGR